MCFPVKRKAVRLTWSMVVVGQAEVVWQLAQFVPSDPVCKSLVLWQE